MNFQQQIQSLFELREAKRQELLLQAYEIKRMEREDYISSLPPLSLPPTVMLERANESTLWLKWARVYKNSYGLRIDPKSITYSVYMAGGFESLSIGDRVMCTPLPKVKDQEGGEEKNGLFAEPSESSVGGSDDESQSDMSSLGAVSEQTPGFKGEIIGAKR